MTADLIERRRVARNEPQSLSVMVAARPKRDWLDHLVSLRLPVLINEQKAAHHHGVTI